ncbi:MAG: DoxX family protein [Bacteroidales bacterium]
MKKFIKWTLSTGNYSALVSTALLFLRIIVAAMMLTHGYGKLQLLTGEGPVQFADPIGIGASASLILAVLAEFLCSILLIFGLTTRYAIIPLLTTMLVAFFVVHASDPFMRKELPLLYAAVFLFIGLLGPGSFSLDKWVVKKFFK